MVKVGVQRNEKEYPKRSVIKCRKECVPNHREARRCALSPCRGQVRTDNEDLITGARTGAVTHMQNKSAFRGILILALKGGRRVLL